MTQKAQTQKALVLSARFGTFAVKDIPIPRPGPSEVLVKVESTALNPVEWKIQTLGVFVSDYPAVLGTDAAGIVEEIGEGVTSLVKGDKILFQGFFQPSYGTLPCARRHHCQGTVLRGITWVLISQSYQIPSNISFDDAASVPVAIASAVLGMYNRHPQSASAHFVPPWEEGGLTTYAGRPALVIGSSSSVGQCALQMAKLSRFSPILTTASPHNAALLQSLGATHILDRNLPRSELLSQVRDILGETSLEFVFDAISLPDTHLLAYDALASSGTLVLSFPSEISSSWQSKEDNTKTIVNLFASLYTPENREIAVALCQRLTGWLESGVLRANSVNILPGGLAAIPSGLERLKNNSISATKLVVRPHEESADGI